MADILYKKINKRPAFNRHHGPELISARLTDWFETNEIELVYIQPGKPQKMASLWRLGYKEERTHESLGNLHPEAYRAKLENSNSVLSH